MSKFSGTRRRPLRPNLTAPIRTMRQRTLTHEGAAAYVRDGESELFLLAATNMVGEDTFYERAADRDERFVELVHQVPRPTPFSWPAWRPTCARRCSCARLRW